ncbi:hypothetical protein KJ809_03095 [Patescibacteria group bacterium]|nr:hypothetical protein [Patescibacteria group bacterium]MBU0897922.1 hypothetical protein [Patescibacteria group bacterium]
MNAPWRVPTAFYNCVIKMNVLWNERATEKRTHHDGIKNVKVFSLLILANKIFPKNI